MLISMTVDDVGAHLSLLGDTMTVDNLNLVLAKITCFHFQSRKGPGKWCVYLSGVHAALVGGAGPRMAFQYSDRADATKQSECGTQQQ